MCWNKEVSVVTYVTVMVLVIILYKRNKGSDRHIALFSAAFVTIQLLEFFAWLSIENKDKKLNDLITRIILIALWAQPLVNSLAAMSKSLNPILITGSIIWGLLFYASIINASSPEEFKSEKGPNCHLVWSRNIGGIENKVGEGSFMGDYKILTFFYLAGLFIPLLFIKPMKRGIKLAIIGFILLTVSRKMSSKTEFSSYWCWAAGVFTVSGLLITK